MYLGKERRNRFVALGLAAVLLAGVVLALLATVATAAPSAGDALGPSARAATADVRATGTGVATDFVTTPAL